MRTTMGRWDDGTMTRTDEVYSAEKVADAFAFGKIAQITDNLREMISINKN